MDCEEVADARRGCGCARDTCRRFGVDDHAGHARTGQREGARVRARGCAVRRGGRARRPGFRALLDEPAAGPRFALLRRDGRGLALLARDAGTDRYGSAVAGESGLRRAGGRASARLVPGTRRHVRDYRLRRRPERARRGLPRARLLAVVEDHALGRGATRSPTSARTRPRTIRTACRSTPTAMRCSRCRGISL